VRSGVTAAGLRVTAKSSWLLRRENLVLGLYLESKLFAAAMEGWTKRRDRLSGRSVTNAGLDKRSESCNVGIERGSGPRSFSSRCGGVHAAASSLTSLRTGVMSVLDAAVQCDAKNGSS
jgi:hypothetical protein